MAQSPNLRILVDGDGSKIYRQGDRVTGRAFLVLEKKEYIKELKVHFAGACITKTTRPHYDSSNRDSSLSNRNFEEQVRLFSIEKTLVESTELPARKHSWTFDFAFPEITERRVSKWSRGSKFQKEPHCLPPSISVRTNSPGGKATVSYYVQARLVDSGIHGPYKVTQHIYYQPAPTPGLVREARVMSRVLYNQIWKPEKDSAKGVEKVFSKVGRKYKSNGRHPRIVPTLYFPEKVAPGQHIPLSIALYNASNLERPQVILDSLNVSIATHTVAICGNPWTQPEDTISRTVTCISRHNINKPIPFDTPTAMTSNFKLVDDAECVPTFKTYTISRRYSMILTVGLKLEGEEQRFTIRSTHGLEILPRMSPEDLALTMRPVDENELDVEPLPLYRAREHSMELAPDYETLYSLSPTPSTNSSLDYFSERVTSPSSSLSSTPGSIPTTPESEIVPLPVRTC
ncbi:hypothetical protein BU24DRAFT_104733 [Aaosphaeria arxii CBS 175.79]|uniref:Arrestin-like N-terminal domain-containing protein n=1 Tax=Aaosphaeria arxii CBS 175.79 TaxID=1450172 RepID=A0A6A5Y0L1_9PLEO|nr:uncharacterized protein BU24DRAFT_104733 [Aaosphaeria arxii CBS 175.79]KAF2018766.1 hypothetical protein BU24DRAFT_104733 [Aaosphaeria arxii CBS 175.79]